MASYFTHPQQTGLGLDMTEMLDFVRKMEKYRNKQELAVAPLATEAFAVQAAAQQATQQTVLQAQVLEQKATQTEELMKFLPYVIGGFGVIVFTVLVIRARRKR